MDISWIKIKTDIFDDEKIKLIEALPEPDSIIVIWFKLLTLAGKSNNNGIFMLSDKIPYTDEMLATIFRRPINTVRLALETFEQFGMIERLNDVITIPKWQKHQNIDGLEKIREQTRLRVQKCRNKQLAQLNNDNCNVTVTLRNATEKRREEKKRKEERREEKKRKEERRENLGADAPISELAQNISDQQINQNYVNQLFDKWKSYGCLNRGLIDFINRMPGLMSYLRGYHSDDVLAAIDNYGKVRNANGWYAQKHNLTFESFCKKISNFLPGNFDLRNFADVDAKAEQQKAIAESMRVFEICPKCNVQKLEWLNDKQRYYCYECHADMAYEEVH